MWASTADSSEWGPDVQFGTKMRFQLQNMLILTQTYRLRLAPTPWDAVIPTWVACGRKFRHKWLRAAAVAFAPRWHHPDITPTEHLQNHGYTHGTKGFFLTFTLSVLYVGILTFLCPKTSNMEYVSDLCFRQRHLTLSDGLWKASLNFFHMAPRAWPFAQC